MLMLKILTYLSKNPDEKVTDIACGLKEDYDGVNKALYDYRDLEFVQFNGFDYSWSLTKAGEQHLSITPHLEEASYLTESPSADYHSLVETTSGNKPFTSKNQDQQPCEIRNLEVDENTAQMFGFLEEWYKMDLTPLKLINEDARVRWCKLTNDTVQGLPGISLGDEVAGNSSWLTIQRLKPIKPPEIDDVLTSWTQVIDNPEIRPRLREFIEIFDASATQELWRNYHEQQALLEEKKEAGEDDDLIVEELVVPNDVYTRVIIEDHPEVGEQFLKYMTTWESWASEEVLRRKTISLYHDLFSYRQQLESGSSSSPLEMVWGVGMTYRSGPNRLRFPLLSLPVEFLNKDDLTLQIASLNRPPVCNIHALLEEFPQGAKAFEANIQKSFKPDSGLPALSPFDFNRLRTIMQIDAGIIDSSTIFAETKPESTEGVTFTLDWALMVQTRSSNYMLEDVQRLKAVAENDGVRQCALQDIAIRRTDPYPEINVNFRGFSHVDMEPLEGAPTRELYFPKPYNQEQVQVIMKLEGSDGVVLQGPPGTGKTHTIANVICHYLASGKRVLVTSQKSPALKALKSQLPYGIQHLTGMLLESDSEGQAELENSINRVTCEILPYSATALREEIKSLESNIGTLHEELKINEKKTAILAHKFQTRPPLHIGCESPRELAEEVVEESSKHDWFVDELNADSGWQENEIDDAFFKNLSRNRQTVGEHLLLNPDDIVSPDRIPSVESAIKLHKALRSYSSIKLTLDQSVEFEIRGYLSPDELDLASQMILDFESLKESLLVANEGDWQKLIAKCYFDPLALPEELEGTEELIKQSLESCFDVQQKGDIETRDYLLKRVELPPDKVNLESLLEKVALASEGQKPFGLTEKISARNLIKAYHALKIRGESPKSREDWSDIKRWIELHLIGNELAKNWNILAKQISSLNVSDDAGTETYVALRSIFKQVVSIRAFDRNLLMKRLYNLQGFLRLEKNPESLLQECLSNPRRLDPIIDTLKLLVSELDGRACAAQIRELKEHLEEKAIYAPHSQFLQERFGATELTSTELEKTWESFLSYAKILWEKSPLLRDVSLSAVSLEKVGAVQFATLVASKPFCSIDQSDGVVVPYIWNTWKWARRKAYLTHIDARSQLLFLNKERLFKERQLAKAYENLAVKQTWRKLKETFETSPNLVTALHQFVSHIKKIGGGTSSLSPFHRTQAQKALAQADEAIRCWIMPQWRISESLPSKFGMFDLVIIDEASQSDLKALPAIARGRKVLVVGDDKQVSPDQIGTPNDKVMELYERFLKNLPFGDSMTIKESIYDLAKIAYGNSLIQLREHFRCAPPIISFSSKHFYDDEIRCLRVPKSSERMLPTLIDVYLEDGIRIDPQMVNHVEADYIVGEIETLIADPEFGNRSIGVITLVGQFQSKIVWDKIQSRIPEEAIIKHEIRCGVPSTFQGSEFDVVFLTMVDHEPKMIRTKKEDKQRYNVAASRARDRMYLCRSVPFEMLKSADLRHKLVSHFSNPGLKVQGSGREDCESPFEEEVFDFLAGKGYMVSTQIAAAGFRIDLVVEDADGRRLAIECDGYRAHPEHKWADDMSRQRVLERAGWSFHRIWGPSYYADRETCQSELLAAINYHGILQHTGNNAAASGIVEFRHVSGKEIEADENLDATQVGNVVSPIDDTNLTELIPDEFIAIVASSQDHVDPTVDSGHINDCGTTGYFKQATNENNPYVDDSRESATDNSNCNYLDLGSSLYQAADFTDFADLVDSELFYNKSYNPLLLELIGYIVKIESPILDDLLVQRIARLHNFKRTGHLIRERVLALVDGNFHLRQDPIDGTFVWSNEESASNGVEFRPPVDGDTARSIEQIPYEEFRAAVLKVGRGCSSVQIARAFGVKRLSSSGKERIDRAIELSEQFYDGLDEV